MKKLQNKLENFGNAVKRLNEVNIEYRKNSDNSIYQDSLIKRFEFTFELAWKALKEFLLEQGFTPNIASPKGIIALAYQNDILNDEKLWLDMLETRNQSAHDYGQELSAEIADKISNRFGKELQNLYKMLSAT